MKCFKFARGGWVLAHIYSLFFPFVNYYNCFEIKQWKNYMGSIKQYICSYLNVPWTTEPNILLVDKQLWSPALICLFVYFYLLLLLSSPTSDSNISRFKAWCILLFFMHTWLFFFFYCFRLLLNRKEGNNLFVFEDSVVVAWILLQSFVW